MPHKKMKTTGIFFVLILTVSCSSKRFTLEQYANYPVKFAKQKISYPNNDFSLLIPKDWDWKVEQYDNENIILGIDAGSPLNKDGYIDIISIQKSKSFSGSKNLKSEFDYLLSQRQSHNMKIVESGETKILKYNAFFIHAKSDTGTYGESEMVGFILDSGTEGVFYYLNAAASQTDEFKKNMAMLIQSFKTFEIAGK